MRRATRWLRAPGISHREGTVAGRLSLLGSAVEEGGRWAWTVGPVSAVVDTREAAEAEVDRRLAGEWELPEEVCGGA